MKQANTRRQERGSSLLFSALLLLIGSVMAGGMLALASADLRMAKYEIEANKVHYLAEAGIYRAISKLRAEEEWTDREETVRFGEGEYRIRIVTERENHSAGNIGKTTVENGKVKSKIVRLQVEGRLPSGARKVIVARYDRDSRTLVDWQEGSADD